MRNILIALFTTALFCFTGIALAETQLDNSVKQTQDLSSDKMNADTNSSSDIQKLRQKSDANINADEPVTKKDASKKTNTTLEKGKSHTAKPKKGGVDVYGGAKSNTGMDNTVKTQDELGSDKMNADTNSSSDIQKLRQKSDASINTDEPVTKKDASKKTNTTLEKGKSHTAKPRKGGVDVYGGAKSNTGMDNTVKTQDELGSDKMNADTNSSSDIQKLRQKSDASINTDEPVIKKDASKKTNTTLEKGKSHTAEPTKGGVDVYGGAKSDTETK